MFVVGKTDIGKQRSENQDRFHVSMLDDDTCVAVVCDGMGGAASGSVASEMASGIVFDRLNLSYRADMEPRSLKALLTSALTAANTVVYQKSRDNEENEGMGTTCVAALLHNDICCIASVGDSRAYILDEMGIKQITTDHTMVEYLHSRGIIDEDEMKVHRMKNVITRAIGVEPSLEVDYFEVNVRPGTVILICTDGLTNYCSDELIYSIVYKRPSEQAVNELIDYANNSGGKDNITAVLMLA